MTTFDIKKYELLIESTTKMIEELKNMAEKI
ncbi:Uncharacterised protein [Lederbergia lenta]|uniref:Uncharacterized protein n=1 Tax=Lederbergia lenta TaxID=1467 RepID=A0A2X4YMT9_LEDLE|nr:Uncharacterised protein [Lederbergia lenta]